MIGSLSHAKPFISKFSQQELAFMPAHVQVKLFKTGVIKPIDVVEAQIQQIEKTNKEINAITYQHFQTARERAYESAKRYASGTQRPLEGITVGLKDEHHEKGMKVTMGSVVHLNDAPKDYTDDVTQKLLDAGVIPLIQTTVPELYLNFVTHSKAWGVTRNPWNPQYSVGASSGGSGAALAAGYVTLATGSDMGGSIRIPASVNGLYGFKPCFGEVFTETPLAPFSGTGPMARNATDMIMMHNVINGHSPNGVNLLPNRQYPTEYQDLKGVKIAYVGGMGITKPSREVDEAMDDAILDLQARGAVVQEVALDFGISADSLRNGFKNLALSGAMGAGFQAYYNDMEEMTGYAATFIKATVEADYGKDQQLDAELMIKGMYAAIHREVFSKGFDLMICPTVATPHIPADYDFTKDTVEEEGVRYDAFVGTLYTMPFNLLNFMPVVSAPVGLSGQNMPIGIQFIGKPYDTEMVFRVVSNFEEETAELYKNKGYKKQMTLLDL
ncbi:amidase (plasmid) [Persicobacter psychrovividus]|uniref:Amidase n=2 Tax=Persicobacter psychrovividus TaxID=387638 RepID=A0ABM7VMD9_9BACT|nr:amidase [Persicobacter psychrovividus]